jgi:nucleotide-binding universal stress UspA family protein
MRAAGRRPRLTAFLVLPVGGGGWGLPSWAYDISTSAHDRAASALAELIDYYAGSFPDVVVAQIVVAGEAVDALREATASAELLVIGRYSGKQREARNLGSVARQLINTARCPTLVTPPIQVGTDTGPSRVISITDPRPQSWPSSAR